VFSVLLGAHPYLTRSAFQRHVVTHPNIEIHGKRAHSVDEDNSSNKRGKKETDDDSRLTALPMSMSADI
jgi:hypothetical protein